MTLITYISYIIEMIKNERKDKIKILLKKNRTISKVYRAHKSQIKTKYFKTFFKTYFKTCLLFHILLICALYILDIAF